MRVLVTGGAGFIGSHVVDQLVGRGDTVRVLDNLSDDAHDEVPPYLNDSATYVRGDVGDPEAVASALGDGVDAVCHQAARVGLGVDFGDVTGYVETNDRGTAVLLAGLHHAGFAGRLVLASSMVVYGEGGYRCAAHGAVRPGPRRSVDLAEGRFEPRCPSCGDDLEAVAVAEDAALDPRSVYAATKLHQEHLCALYGRSHDSPVIALRYHNVYGPRMPRDTPYAGVASIFRSELAAGRPPRVFEDGGQLRDFVHVRDVAQANLAALDAPAGVVGAFNIASGDRHTVGDLASGLARLSDAGVVPVVTGQFRLEDVRHVVASPDQAREHLGFAAAIAFADGLAEFVHAPLRGPASERGAEGIHLLC